MAAGSESNVSLGEEQRQSQQLISPLPPGVTARLPHPGHWTMVRELNMENRDPCEIWRSGINQTLCTLKQKIERCTVEIEKLERDIEKDRSNLNTLANYSIGGPHGD